MNLYEVHGSDVIAEIYAPSAGQAVRLFVRSGYGPVSGLEEIQRNTRCQDAGVSVVRAKSANAVPERKSAGD